MQEREVRPVGAKETVSVQARILASADEKLSDLLNAGKFRRDLYFRLNVVNIRLPALAERREDIPLLTDHILRRIRRESGIPYELDSQVREMLDAHDWPGNVRELENALQRACTMASSPYLTGNDFPSDLRKHLQEETAATSSYPLRVINPSQVESIAALEKQAILNTIQQLGGDKMRAAKLLGIGKTTLYRKLKEYGIETTGSN